MNITDRGLLVAHHFRVQHAAQYLRGDGPLPERILGTEDAAHCHLALWLDQLFHSSVRPAEIDRLHQRLHALLRDNVHVPGSPEARQLAQTLLETNAAFMDTLQRVLESPHGQ